MKIYKKTKSFKVVKVIDEFTLVINIGSDDEIEKGQRFLVYSISPDDIIDPDTNESLGKLEIVKGTGTVTHVQEKMATIESSEKIFMIPRTSFTDPLVGDSVKRVP